MEAYSKSITVQEDDLDDLDHVNNVRYVQWIQDISKEHWLSVVTPELRKNVVWVVRNHNIDYKGAAVLGDTLHIKTYIAETRGALSTRVVEMHHADSGALLVRSKTSWCLLHAGTLRPMRITESISRLFIHRTGTPEP